MECYPLILIGLKSLFVALIIHFVQVPAFDCEQVACSINSGEGESTHKLEDICTNGRPGSPLTRMVAWPLVGAAVTLSDVLHSNVNWNFPLLSRSHTSTIFIGIATSVVTNLLLASSTNRGQSRSNERQNRLNIEVDVNDRQTLSSLSDMLNTTFLNLDIERVSDDIFILNVSAATEIPPHDERLRENLEILMKKVTHVYQSLEQYKSLLQLKSTENGKQKQKDEKRDYAKENQEYDGTTYKLETKNVCYFSNPYFHFARLHLCLPERSLVNDRELKKNRNVDGWDSNEMFPLNFTKEFMRAFESLQNESQVALHFLKHILSDVSSARSYRPPDKRITHSLKLRLHTSSRGPKTIFPEGKKGEKKQLNTNPLADHKVDTLMLELWSVYKIRIVILLTLLTVPLLYTWSYIILGLVRKLEKHKTKEITAKSQKDRLQQSMSDARVVKRERMEVSHKPIISVSRISVVVISFTASNAEKHFEITKSLIEGESDYPLKKLLIRSPGDLEKLPRSKVALIYIDFNELNVILEEQNKKNPDQKKQLRSLTVKNILDTKEMEAIVIYCFDAASDKLDWGQHYAQKLITISTHPLLKKLEEKKCVFSINKKFTPFQKAALNKKLQGLIPK